MSMDEVNKIVNFIRENQPVKVNHLKKVTRYPENAMVQLELYTKKIYEDDDGRLYVLEDE